MRVRAALAQSPVWTGGIAIRSELDSYAASVAKRRLELGWILQHVEIVFVRAIPDIHLRPDRLSAEFAILPMPFVPVVPVKRAKRVAVVIAGATVPRIGEQGVFVMVVANPVAATRRLVEVSRLAAQTAPGFVGFWFG